MLLDFFYQAGVFYDTLVCQFTILGTTLLECFLHFLGLPKHLYQLIEFIKYEKEADEKC